MAAAASHEVFDLTINLGHLITIGGLLVTTALGYAALRNAVAILGNRASQIDTKVAELKASFDDRAEKTDDRIDAVIIDMKKMTDVLVQIGRQEERLTSLDQRLLMQSARFEEQQGQLSRLRDDYIKVLTAKAQSAIDASR